MMLLNEKLIKKQKLYDHDVLELQGLHSVKDVLFLTMDKTDNIVDLVLYFALLESLEYNMQRVWRFSQDKSKHTWRSRAPQYDYLLNLGFLQY